MSRCGAVLFGRDALGRNLRAGARANHDNPLGLVGSIGEVAAQPDAPLPRLQKQLAATETEPARE